MRLFLAVDIPDEVKKQISQQIEPLKRDYPYFSWVPEQNYHITLYFLGEVEKANVDPIKQRISDLLYASEAFQMFSFNVDMFINQRIKVYMSFQRQKKLEAIESIIASELQVKHNYKYVPHLTLARWKIPSKQQYFHLQNKLENTDVNIEFPVTHVSLYQSILQPDAPVYDKIAEFPLLQE